MEKLWTRDFSLLSAAHLLMAVAFYSTMPVFTLFLEQRLGLSGFTLGLVASSSIFSALLARPLAGVVLDHLGRRVVYVPAYLAFAAFFFAYLPAQALWTVALARFFHGLAWGILVTAAMTVAVDLLPQGRRGEGIGYFSLFMVLAMSVGPALGVGLKDAWGFNALFAAAGGVALLGWTGALSVRALIIPEGRRRFSLKDTFEKSAIPFGLVVFFILIPYGCLMNYSAMYAERELLASGGTFFIFFAIGTGVARLFSGRFFDHRGPRLILAISFLLLVAGLSIMALTRSAACFYAAALIQGVGDGMGIPVITAMINNMVKPQRRGAANATFMTFFELGICAGVLLTGYLYPRLGWSMVFALFAGCCLTAALLSRFWALPRYAAGTV